MTHVAEKPSTAPRAEVSAVADSITALMRSFLKARARMVAAAQHDIEWSSHIILKVVAGEGPVRASTVAEFLQSDPSTVSRQVATLVKDGLLERRADPEDGRASLLVLTPKADAVLAEHDQIRLDYFAGMLDDWSDADLRRFAAQLQRFTQAHEATNTAWIADRFANRSGRAGSTN